jgi:hypothetical protein
MSVTIKGKTFCRECMLKDEEPIEVVLVRSSWAPWGEQPVIPVNDLLHSELRGRDNRDGVLPLAAQALPTGGEGIK